MLNILKLSLQKDQIQLEIELLVLGTGDTFHRLNNKKRPSTVPFRYPLNRYFYIAATQSFIKKLLCCGVLCGSDSYLLHSPLISGPFESFQRNRILNVVNDSDRDFESRDDGSVPHPGSISAGDQLREIFTMGTMTCFTKIFGYAFNKERMYM